MIVIPHYTIFLNDIPLPRLLLLVLSTVIYISLSDKAYFVNKIKFKESVLLTFMIF